MFISMPRIKDQLFKNHQPEIWAIKQPMYMQEPLQAGKWNWFFKQTFI